jgi:hypothetical protein
MAELTSFQQKIKAQTIVDKLQLDATFATLDVVLPKLFADAAPSMQDRATKEEVAALVKSIKQRTADNVKIARFLELGRKIGFA